MILLAVFFLIGVVFGLVLAYSWYQWKEEIIDGLIITGIWVSSVAGLGSFIVLIYGKAAPNPELYSPQNPSAFWAILVLSSVGIIFFGFLRWKRNYVLRRWRRSARKSFQESLDQQPN